MVLSIPEGKVKLCELSEILCPARYTVPVLFQSSPAVPMRKSTFNFLGSHCYLYFFCRVICKIYTLKGYYTIPLFSFQCASPEGICLLEKSNKKPRYRLGQTGLSGEVNCRRERFQFVSPPLGYPCSAEVSFALRLSDKG